MPKRVPKRTIRNPFGLTYKQDMVIRDVVKRVSKGDKMKLVESVEKFYDVKNRNSANQIVTYNMKNQNFREALINGLIEKNILGANSITEGKLIEGLEATSGQSGAPDYDTRLKYIQEIHKVAGVYAPEVKKNLNLNVDMSEEELDKHIKELQAQLE